MRSFSNRIYARAGLGLALTSLLAAVACKKNDGESAGGGYVQGQTGPAGAAGAAGAAMVGQGGAAGAAPGTAGTAPTAGAATAAAGAGALPQRLDATAAAAVAPLLTELAKKETQPGAKPVGEALVASFGPGTSLEIPVQLVPNKCYSVVAVGLPQVTEVALELQLTTPIPGMAPVLAVDQDTGPNAVLGRKTTCYKWMFGVIPAPAKVIVRVTSGTGLVAAQTFEK
jgi:hypothetical protein